MIERRNNGFGKGTFVESGLFTSIAFLNLTGAAPQILILFLGLRDFPKRRKGERKRNLSCTNCDSLTMPYLKLQALGLTKPRITRGIDELLAKGFITIKHRGGAYKQDKTIYALSEKWTFWTPRTVFERRERDAKRGYQRNKK